MKHPGWGVFFEGKKKKKETIKSPEQRKDALILGLVNFQFTGRTAGGHGGPVSSSSGSSNTKKRLRHHHGFTLRSKSAHAKTYSDNNTSTRWGSGSLTSLHHSALVGSDWLRGRAGPTPTPAALCRLNVRRHTARLEHSQ